MQNQVGIVLIRIVLGVTFLANGIVKFQTLEGVVGWFQSIGLPPFLAGTVATLETAGGLALVVGLGTRAFAAAFALMLLGAIAKVKWAIGFLGDPLGTGWELDLALIAMAVCVGIAGGSDWSLDRLLSRRRDPMRDRFTA